MKALGCFALVGAAAAVISFCRRGAATIAWIRYWVYGDQEAKQYFYGDDCVMCESPWTNTQRKDWE